MADNVVANAGAGGATFRTDDDGTAHWPYTKLAWGADNTQTIVAAGAGAIPVQDGGNSLTVDNGGTFAVQVSAALPAGNNNIGDVDIVTLPALAAGTNNIGDVDVLTLPAIPAGANAIGTVAINAAIPAGNNNIGDVDIASAIPAGNNNIGDVDVVTLPSIPAGNNNIGDVDVITLPGTFAEDSAHNSGDTGHLALSVRRDANTSLVGTDGDYAPLQVDATGNLKVAIISGAGSGGTSATDDAAFSVAAGSGTPIMGLADETSPDSVDEGDVGVVRMTLARALHVNLRDTAGNSLTPAQDATHDAVASTTGPQIMGFAKTTAPGNVSADGDAVSLWALRNGTLAVNLRDSSGTEVSVGGGTQYDEDTAHVSGDKITMAGVVRADTAAAQSGTDGDRSVLITDASGRLHVNVGNTVNVASHAVTNAGTFAVQAGQAAHDAAITGNPVRAGLRARTSDFTPVANDDTTDVTSDTLGKQIVLQGATHEQQVNGTTNYTNTTAADVIAAQGAGIRIVVTSILVTNAHATVGTKVEIRDGTTVKIIGYAAAVGGGFALNGGGRPLFIGTANTAITARDVTTGSDVDVSISGYKITN